MQAVAYRLIPLYDDEPVGDFPEDDGVLVTITLDQYAELVMKEKRRAAFAAFLTKLSRRQFEVLILVLDGRPNKNIASDLGISQRTVENHRAEVMKRTCCKNLPSLVKLASDCNLNKEILPRIPDLQSFL